MPDHFSSWLGCRNLYLISQTFGWLAGSARGHATMYTRKKINCHTRFFIFSEGVACIASQIKQGGDEGWENVSSISIPFSNACKSSMITGTWDTCLPITKSRGSSDFIYTDQINKCQHTHKKKHFRKKCPELVSIRYHHQLEVSTNFRRRPSRVHNVYESLVSISFWA